MPLRNTVKQETQSMQLICSLCPTTPIFSDTSHLLTHVASKAHLSHRFKIQIRAQSEPEARRTLENFDSWYKSNGLDAMLSARLAAKEKKKTSKKRNFKENTRRVKQEPTSVIDPQLEDATVYHTAVPRMYNWPIGTNNSNPQLQEERDALAKLGNDQRDEQGSYFLAQQKDELFGFRAEERLRDTDAEGEEIIDDYGIGQLKPANSFKLKGIFWPGMDMFDSATADMRRTRNQRKDVSVLEQMKEQSHRITALEVAYEADGSYHHMRDIYGPLSSADNSPIKERETSPNKMRHPKVENTVLGEISVNISRLRPRFDTKAHDDIGGDYDDWRHLNPSRVDEAQYGQDIWEQSRTLNPLAVFNGAKCSPSGGEDEEFKLTYGKTPKKRPFAIFTESPNVSPGRTESPLGVLEDLEYDFLTQGFNTHNNENLSNQGSPTPSSRTKGSLGKGKRRELPSLPDHHGLQFPQNSFKKLATNPFLSRHHIPHTICERTPIHDERQMRDNRENEMMGAEFSAGICEHVEPSDLLFRAPTANMFGVDE